MMISLTHLPNLGVVDVSPFKGDLQLIMVDDYWSQVDDCRFIVSSCCWRKDFSNTLWFFMISDILSGSSFTNVLRVLVKILTHFVLVMSRTVFATTTCVWQIDTSDIAGIIVMVRVELVPMTWRYKSEKTYLTPPETKRGVGLGREKGAFWTSHLFFSERFLLTPNVGRRSVAR